MGATIVVGVDGSASAHAAVTWAAAEARMREAAVHLVVAYRYPLAFAGTGADPSVAAPDEQRRAEAVLDEAIAAAGEELDGLGVSRHVKGGEGPGHALVSHAAGADLLVLGTKGLGGVSGFTLGSVSHYCVSHAHCPVVVVPVPGSRG
jgi:nucleotide-binding universal stress UspA family protein